jgi:hypothetical protein
MENTSFRYKKFIIFAGSYSEDSGGTVVLHHLCHLLNEIGYEAYLYPAFKTTFIHQEKWLKPLLSILYASFKSRYLRSFKTLHDNNTPVFIDKNYQNISDEYVVIYAEGVAGNPLNAKNVVRWLLQKPGYNYKGTFFGNSELVFSYNPVYLDNFNLPFSKLAKNRLFTPLVNLKYYTEAAGLKHNQRNGVAYCIRKGRGKKFVHNDDAILIDNLSHAETAEIFRSVKTFISYDSMTAYSEFASICGADSIVIPDADVAIDDWLPENLRYGISYGFNNVDWARETRPLLISRINKDISKNYQIIQAFVNETNEYFTYKHFR